MSMTRKVEYETVIQEMLTLTALKERGWTDRTIRDLLVIPDQLKTNPQYSSAAPMKLYELERVAKAETSPEFVEAASKKSERSVRAKEVADRRRADLVSEADGWKIEFFDIPKTLVLLEKQAVDAKEGWYLRKGESDWIDRKVLDSITLHRWCQNYLRHECSNYEELINRGRGKPGVGEVYDCVIRPKVDKMVIEIINTLRNMESRI